MVGRSSRLPPAEARRFARWRLWSQRLARPAATDAGVVEHLLGVQAENLEQSKWSVAARTTEPDRARLDQLVDDGQIIRTHVLRPTWHYVRPDDLVWLLELTAPRVRPVFRRQLEPLGVGDAEVGRAAGIIESALQDHGHLTRDEVGIRLGAGGLPGAGHALGLLLGELEITGLICSGRAREGRHSYALVTERAPHARRLDPDEALEEITRRYFTGHGPATERDLAYWATLTLGQVRRGLSLAAPRLDRIDIGGSTFWFGWPAPPDEPPRPRAHLLQILDELYRGYQDSRSVIDAEGFEPTGRVTTLGMVLVDGQLVGSAQRTVAGRELRFVVVPFRPLSDDKWQAVEDAAVRAGTFAGLDATVQRG